MNIKRNERDDKAFPELAIESIRQAEPFRAADPFRRGCPLKKG
jgi:hypothetical protein